MTKQILPNELAEIVTGLLIKPELLGELDSREAHQAFMLDIGRVIADHCGGRVNGITDGDVAKPYLSDIECTPHSTLNPMTVCLRLNVTYGQIIMLKPGQTRDRKLSSTGRSETLTELPCNLCLLWPHKNNLSVLLLLNE